jgi:hypothetical protein
MGYIAKKATRKTQRSNVLEMGAAIAKVALGASLLSFDPSAFTPPPFFPSHVHPNVIFPLPNSPLRPARITDSTLYSLLE